MQGNPRSDRDWEHWPGRTPPDDGIRHRLKGLFTPSTENEVEAHIAERGREIEHRTEQLQNTISDLERREEQTAKLRASVEEMLRHGSAELDDRDAELAGLALDLAGREERVRAAERDLAIRTQELGAVELRRAAVERREQALDAREESLSRSDSERASREGRVAAPETGFDTSASDTQPSNHILIGPGDGYWIAEGDGRAPTVGATLDIGGREFVVSRVGRSPLPGDNRACAYLESATGTRSA